MKIPDNLKYLNATLETSLDDTCRSRCYGWLGEFKEHSLSPFSEEGTLLYREGENLLLQSGQHLLIIYKPTKVQAHLLKKLLHLTKEEEGERPPSPPIKSPDSRYYTYSNASQILDLVAKELGVEPPEGTQRQELEEKISRLAPGPCTSY